MSDTKECARQGCNCQVSAGKSFCCDACERAEKQGTNEKCTCNNPDCSAR